MNQNQEVARDRVINQVNEMRKYLDEIEEQMKIGESIQFTSLEDAVTAASHHLEIAVNDCYGN